MLYRHAQPFSIYAAALWTFLAEQTFQYIDIYLQLPMLWNTTTDMNKLAENLLNLARNKGLIRPCDLAPLGIPRVSLTRTVRR